MCLGRLVLTSTILAIATWNLGCGKTSTDEIPAPVTPAPETESAAETPGETSEDAEIAQAMSELPEEDRTLATAQKICPVSDHALGSMGAPVKVTVEGQVVFLCCEGCKPDIEKSPAEYLAKLKAK